MILHFNVNCKRRKAMVKAIEEELGTKATYLGVPSCAYSVGDYTVGRNGELEFSDEIGIDETSRIVDACVMAAGESPAEWDGKTDDEADTPQEENVGLTVALPIDKVNVENLKAILESKGGLIGKALGVKELPVEAEGDRVSFPWFKDGWEIENAQTYTRFIVALCEMSIRQKRVQSKEKEVENEKYAFRCFLLRLGYIGDGYKADRKILLKNFEGSASYRDGKKKEEQA